MTRQTGQRFRRFSRQSVAAGEVDDVDGALRRRIGMPWPAVGAGSEFRDPALPQRCRPVRIDCIARERQPGKPVRRQPGFEVRKIAGEKRARVVRRQFHRGVGQAKRNRRRRRGECPALGLARPARLAVAIRVRGRRGKIGRMAGGKFRRGFLQPRRPAQKPTAQDRVAQNVSRLSEKGAGHPVRFRPARSGKRKHARFGQEIVGDSVDRRLPHG